MMGEMASGFEDVLRGCSEGKDPSVEGAVDGMLRQLLGKDLMYRPMRDICDKFPEWLVEHKEGLSEEEYQRYGKQYQCFQRIVTVYETKPDDFDRLSELMHDIQEYGMPPPELIRELAPGLRFDEKGMPKMDAAMFGGTSLPFDGDDAQCCTM